MYFIRSANLAQQYSICVCKSPSSLLLLWKAKVRKKSCANTNQAFFIQAIDAFTNDVLFVLHCNLFTWKLKTYRFRNRFYDPIFSWVCLKTLENLKIVIHLKFKYMKNLLDKSPSQKNPKKANHHLENGPKALCSKFRPNWCIFGTTSLAFSFCTPTNETDPLANYYYIRTAFICSLSLASLATE